MASLNFEKRVRFSSEREVPWGKPMASLNFEKRVRFSSERESTMGQAHGIRYSSSFILSNGTRGARDFYLKVIN